MKTYIAIPFWTGLSSAHFLSHQSPDFSGKDSLAFIQQLIIRVDDIPGRIDQSGGDEEQPKRSVTRRLVGVRKADDQGLAIHNISGSVGLEAIVILCFHRCDHGRFDEKTIGSHKGQDIEARFVFYADVRLPSAQS